MSRGWSSWKHYPNVARGENIEAPCGPGVFEVRYVTSGALHSFGTTDNIAEALSRLSTKPKSASSWSWFARRDRAPIPDLDYRVWPTATMAHAKSAATSLMGRREVYMSIAS